MLEFSCFAKLKIRTEIKKSKYKIKAQNCEIMKFFNLDETHIYGPIFYKLTNYLKLGIENKNRNNKFTHIKCHPHTYNHTCTDNISYDSRHVVVTEPTAALLFLLFLDFEKNVHNSANCTIMSFLENRKTERQKNYIN